MYEVVTDRQTDKRKDGHKSISNSLAAVLVQNPKIHKTQFKKQNIKPAVQGTTSSPTGRFYRSLYLLLNMVQNTYIVENPKINNKNFLIDIPYLSFA